MVKSKGEFRVNLRDTDPTDIKRTLDYDFMTYIEADDEIVPPIE
ncbi:MAG: hypothetical protein ACOCQR_02180 [bacterium]